MARTRKGGRGASTQHPAVSTCGGVGAHVAKDGDPPLPARSAHHLQPGHCFSQVGSKGFVLFPIEIPSELGKTDAEKLNPSSILECSPSCQHRMGYSFQMLAACSKHACCSPHSDGLAPPAAAPHSHREPPSSLCGWPIPPLPVVGGRVGAWGWCRAQPGCGTLCCGAKPSTEDAICLFKGAWSVPSLHPVALSSLSLQQSRQ